MALCGLHHWTFDQGLVGVTEDYGARVSPAVAVEEQGAQPILRLAERGLRPARRALRWWCVGYEAIEYARGPSRREGGRFGAAV